MNVLKGFVESVKTAERIDQLEINLVGKFPNTGKDHMYKIVLHEKEMGTLLVDHVIELIIMNVAVNKDDGYMTFDKYNNRFFKFSNDAKQDFASGFLRMTDMTDKDVLWAIKGFKGGYCTIIVHPNDKKKDTQGKLKDTQINIIFKEK